MVGLKRRASDTLLPLRAPKQPRTTTHHPLGGNSTPSQNEALLARWKKLSVEFCRVVADTVACVARCECRRFRDPLRVVHGVALQHSPEAPDTKPCPDTIRNLQYP